MSTPEDQQPDSIAEVRAEIEETREELGETVEALTAKADVKARANEKVEEVKQQANEKVEEVRQQAADTAHQAQATVKEKPVPTAAIAAGAVLIIAIIVWRRRG